MKKIVSIDKEILKSRLNLNKKEIIHFFYSLKGKWKNTNILTVLI